MTLLDMLVRGGELMCRPTPQAMQVLLALKLVRVDPDDPRGARPTRRGERLIGRLAESDLPPVRRCQPPAGRAADGWPRQRRRRA